MGIFSGLFSLTKEIAIDLGTANTIIIHNDKIVIDEPSIVAREKKTGKMIAVGREAQQMRGKENEGIETIRPLRKGVIADFNAAEMMIRGLIKRRARICRDIGSKYMPCLPGSWRGCLYNSRL